MPVLRNIGFLARCLPEGAQADIHPIRNAALAWEGKTIAWIGPEVDLPSEFQAWATEDAEGRLVVPGLVDCHTHLAFGGWRSDEFEARLLGKSYLEIAAAGGGIASTVRHTREATRDALLERCRGFLVGMARLGVTTVECKSGYGLSVERELVLLEVYAELARTERMGIVSTLLGAHIVPPEYRDRRTAYVDLLVDELIPAVARARLAQFCDVFVEQSAFSVAEARRILLAGKAVGLRPKLHADQLSDGGGALLAAEVGAASADHLEYISDSGIAAMARAGVVAVSLPLASVYLGQPPLRARRLIDAGVAVGVATDFNPGSAPSYDLHLALFLACTLERMTPAEVLKGATIIAARALGLEDSAGCLAARRAADFAVIDAPDPTFWMYHFRPETCLRTVRQGETVWFRGRSPSCA